MYRRLIFAGIVMASALASVSCQKTDLKSGQEYVDEITGNFESMIEQGTILGSGSNQNVYVTAAESAQEAWESCSMWMYSQVSESAVFVIPDGMGTVEAWEADQEGAYVYVTFKLEGYNEFRLEYLNPNYMNDDNVFPRPGWPPTPPIL